MKKRRFFEIAAIASAMVMVAAILVAMVAMVIPNKAIEDASITVMCISMVLSFGFVSFGIEV